MSTSAEGAADAAGGAGRPARVRAADRACAEFAPMVAVPAVATAGFWLGTGAGGWTAVSAALAVLVVACPAALGLATRTVRRISARRGRRLGVHLPFPKALEAARRIDTAMLVIAGTVTAGPPSVVAVHVAEGVSEREALRLAGAVEAACLDARAPGANNRPRDVLPEPLGQLGRAVAEAARERYGTLPDAADVDRCQGLGTRGVVAELDGDRVIAHAVLVGRPGLLAEHDIRLPGDLTAACTSAEAAGRTPLVVAWDGTPRAVLELADPLRSATAEAVHRLRALGVTPMLLAEDAVAARVLAADAGLAPGEDTVVEAAGPAEQLCVVRRLQRTGRVVAVAGDPAVAGGALSAADLAVAVGSEADPDAIALARPDLKAAADAIRLARGVSRTTGRNRGWVLGYTLATVPMAAAGVLNPVGAVVATLAASGYVVVNSLLPYR